jgi:transposase-like protein
MHGVQRYVPEFEKRWHRFARNASSSWRVDQTYMRVSGTWLYLYRAVDREGKTVDFRLSPRRNVAAAKAFLRKARHAQAAAPTSITLDGYAASHKPDPKAVQREGIFYFMLTPAPKLADLR